MRTTRPRTRRLVAITAVTGAVVGGTALAGIGGPANATTTATYNVRAGSAPLGTVVQVTGATTGSTPQIVLNDVTAGVQASCDSGTGAGSFKVGDNLSGTAIAQLDGSKLLPVNCVGPLNLKLKLVASGIWNINAASLVNGVATGTLTGIEADVVDVNTGGSACKFHASGSVKGKLTVKTLTMKTSSAATLKISNVTGCFGLIFAGDKANILLSLKLKTVNPAYSPITVTQNP